MGQFGGFYKGEKKKKKKKTVEKKAKKLLQKESYILPEVQIIKKGKKDS